MIPPFVKVIPARAFHRYDYKDSQLTSAELPKGLEEIGEKAFKGCWSLQTIVIPPFVKAIGKDAFC